MRLLEAQERDTYGQVKALRANLSRTERVERSVYRGLAISIYAKV
jgi:hypothetical protein